jgi:hypothetical protein
MEYFHWSCENLRPMKILLKKKEENTLQNHYLHYDRVHLIASFVLTCIYRCATTDNILIIALKGLQNIISDTKIRMAGNEH